MINCLFVGMGGFIGSVCRYLLGLLPIENSQGFPVKTLITNVIGAFVIGIIAAAAAKKYCIESKACAVSESRDLRRLYNIFNLCL